MFAEYLVCAMTSQGEGDSKVIIDWLTQKSNVYAIDIEGFKRRIKVLITNFQEVSFHHIFRNFSLTLTKKHITFPNKVFRRKAY